MTYVILMFLLFVCFAHPAVFVRASTQDDDIASLCGGRPLSVLFAHRLKTKGAVGMYLAAGSTCTVRIRSEFHLDDSQANKLRMQVLSLRAPCGEATLQLFDGDDHTGHELSGKICGDISGQQTMFLSSKKNFITVNIHRYTSGYVSLSLLATATSHRYHSTDFVCENRWDIDGSLQCDGYNNCGDWSDENSYFCSDDLGRLKAIIIIGCSLTSFFIVLACGIGFAVRYRNRRLQTRNFQAGRSAVPGVTTPITAGREAAPGAPVTRVPPPPYYGSTQTGTIYPSPLGIMPHHGNGHPTAATTTTPTPKFLPAFAPAPPPYSPRRETYDATASKLTTTTTTTGVTGGAAYPGNYFLPPPPPYYGQQQCTGVSESGVAATAAASASGATVVRSAPSASSTARDPSVSDVADVQSEPPSVIVVAAAADGDTRSATAASLAVSESRVFSRPAASSAQNTTQQH